jgi:DNA-binding MarR family transcriptional regulator
MSTLESGDPVLAFALKRAQHAFRTSVDTSLRPLELTAPQYAILAAVASDAGVSSAELARVAFVTPQTMQGILSNMIRAGLLSRAPHPQNRRVLQTGLTDKGSRVYAEARRLVHDIEHALVDAVGEANVPLLVDMLARCAEALSIPRPASRPKGGG